MSAPTATTFGPSALATPANALTVTRLLLSPILFGVIAAQGASWWAFALTMALGLSDGLDGYIARRQGTTRSGAFLDPLADKVLILGAMIMLVSIGSFWWLPVAIIGVRELAVSLLRTYWGRRGLALPATGLAKLKTLVQGFAVVFAVLPPTASDATWVATGLLWAAVVLTVVTGVQYFVVGRRAVTEAGQK